MKDEFKVDFIVVGAQRSGTTALFYLIKEHPEIFMYKTKEVDFFCNNSWFTKDTVDYTKYHELFLNRIENQICGEASPNYLPHPLVAKRIKDYNPNIKLIFLLRNPIDRAFSAHTRWVQGGNDTRPFELALLEELKGVNRDFGYLNRGHYSEQLQTYFDIFSKEQLFIRKTSDFMNDNLSFISELFKFLNIKDFKYMNNPYEKYIKKNYRSMSENTREILLDYFIPEIEKLESLLKWDLSDWKK